MAVKAVGNRTCTDIRSVDFGNLKFKSAGTTFAFHKGKAYSWDCPDCGADSARADWEATIEQDKVISPSPGIRIRFLLMHDNHLTGTGLLYHVVGFRCEATGSANRGRLLKVFDRKGMSLQLERIDNQGVTLTAFTVPGKPVVEHFAHRWNNDVAQFVLEKTWTTKMHIPYPSPSPPRPSATAYSTGHLPRRIPTLSRGRLHSRDTLRSSAQLMDTDAVV